MQLEEEIRRIRRRFEGLELLSINWQLTVIFVKVDSLLDLNSLVRDEIGSTRMLDIELCMKKWVFLEIQILGLTS